VGKSPPFEILKRSASTSRSGVPAKIWSVHGQTKLYKPQQKDTNKSKKQNAANVVAEYLIGVDDMAMVYVSPDPFISVFEEEVDLRKFDLSTHRIAGICFFEKDSRFSLPPWLLVPLAHEYPVGELVSVVHG
jgi:hypothetical protein